MRKIFIDSDSVIYPFMAWCRQYDPAIFTTDSEKVYKLMAEHYIDCFDGEMRYLPHSEFFLDTVRNNQNAFILTALTPAEKLAPYTDDPDYIVHFHLHNKIKWYERLGIDKSKLHIVQSFKEKLDYCQPGDILFDDFKKNLERWEERGGIGIEVVHPAEKDLQYDKFSQAEHMVDTLAEILKNLTDNKVKNEIQKKLPEFSKIFEKEQIKQIVL